MLESAAAVEAAGKMGPEDLEQVGHCAEIKIRIGKAIPPSPSGRRNSNSTV